METVSVDSVVASVALPEVGASQNLTIIRTERSQVVGKEGLLLDWRQLPNTVVANAFTGKDVYLPTPNGNILLPPLDRRELREKEVADNQGRILGTMLQLPSIFTMANRLAYNHINKSVNYNYDLGISHMVNEAAALFASVVRRDILRIREKPGIMGHIQAVPELGYDEIGISESWEAKLLGQLNLGLTTLDGFPVWGIRYPIANEFGIQPMVLRTLQGFGRYIGINPWVLSKRMLGDEDGDLGYVVMRAEEWKNGHLNIENRRKIHITKTIKKIRGRLTAQNLFDLGHLQFELNLSDKDMEKLTVDYNTTEKRLQAIEDADARQGVAILTMIAWFVARVLTTSGTYGAQESYRKAFNMVEPLLENSFDCRKAGSAFGGGSFDTYKFQETLMRGGNLPIQQLEELGIPVEALNTLSLAWSISNGRLGNYANRSPVFRNLTTRANNPIIGAKTLLETFKLHGVAPTTIYNTIINDLSLVNVYNP